MEDSSGKGIVVVTSLIAVVKAAKMIRMLLVFGTITVWFWQSLLWMDGGGNNYMAVSELSLLYWS